MKKTFLIFGASLGLAIILSGCQNPITNTPAKTPESTKTDVSQPVGMANPASVNCVEKGGTLEMRNNKNGEYGVCLFEDNRQCEEWALLRGQCPEGGVKITGYDNDAEIYCAITGGQAEGVGTETPMCKRIDGTYCNAQANLDGECPNPNDPNPNAGNTEAQ
jgi:putative hemolysin